MPAINNIKRLVKPALARLVAQIRRPTDEISSSGSCYCPICESRVQSFLPFGDPPRASARCPICGSLERHRLDWLYFKEKTDLFDGAAKKMLHIAPEKFLAGKFSEISNLDYLSADLSSLRAMVKMDITAINYPANSFSIIYCSHVLEHVADDRKAIAEFYRVLSPGGWAVLQVPIMAQETYENPAIIEPGERKKHFGQWDHVRRCGPDYVERIREAGFAVQVFRGTDLAPKADCAMMGFDPNRLIFSCRKPLSGGNNLQNGGV